MSHDMTHKLSDIQLIWLRGLATEKGYVPMSASELGNPEVSELQSRDLVKIQWPTFASREWRITDEGRSVVAATERQSGG